MVSEQIKVCTYMSDLSPETLRRLAEKLDVIQPAAHNWRKLLSIMEKFCCRNYQDYEIEDFAKEIATIDGSPSGAFLRDLVKQRTPVAYLKEALKAMRHVSALEMLGVREHPSVIHQPQSFNEGREGTSLTITCKGYGIPRPNYQWFKNNDHIWVEIAYPQLKADLYFQYLTLADSGVYQCFLRNEVGEIRTKECTLKVIPNSRETMVNPIESQAFTLTITKQVPPEIRILENEVLIIMFDVSPQNGCEYTWYHKPHHCGVDLTLIVGENTFQLIRRHVSYDDEGIYCCRISNQYDTKQSDYCCVNIESIHGRYRRYTNPQFANPARTERDTLSRAFSLTNMQNSSHHKGEVNSDSGCIGSNNSTYDRNSRSTISVPSRTRTAASYSLDYIEPPPCTSECGIIQEVAPGNTVSLNHYNINADIQNISEYKWFFVPLKDLNCRPILIPGWNEKEIEMTITSDTDYGWYYCEQHTMDCIVPSSKTKVCPPITMSTNCRDKVALLIGNQKYREDIFTLFLPESDTRDLAGFLRSLGFRVVTLVNLSSKEMYTAIEHFLLLLNTGVYALFFYGGHGFELDGENYLMGVECSREYKTEHCVAASWIQQKIATRNAKLNMMILDMCRTKIITKGETRSLQPISLNLLNAFHIIAYSCSPSCMAFERKADDNSIYMTELLKCIGEKKPIHSLLFEVARRVEQVGRDAEKPAEKWMRPYYTSNLTEELTLHDQIDSSGPFTHEYQGIILKWQEAHRHPMPRTINSDDGVIVLRLHFDAEFSNVLIVAVEIMKGSLMQAENVRLKEVLVFQNVETIAIAIPMKCEDISNISCSGSLTKIDNLLGTYRVPDLQKFQASLKFHFVIEYRYENALKCESIHFVPNPPPLYSNLVYNQVGNEH